jgi:PTS system mannose-specific IIB component/fructoselysine and glucoselysine-specific PTS system IIB component
VDDRLVHGQVVLGWGQALHAAFIVLVDDAVAGSGWEQELYRMGVPPEMDVYFAGVDDAARQLDEWLADSRIGILLTPDLETMNRLCAATQRVRKVNLGGIHHRPGRAQKLRYLYLAPADEDLLRTLSRRGIEVTAQDVPTAEPVPVEQLVSKESAA